MSNGHTPAPWSVGYANVKEEAEAGIHGPGEYGYIICDMQVDGYDKETQVANARLISAAPELLEALEGMVKAYDDGVQPDWALPYIRAAHAALAKARGA